MVDQESPALDGAVEAVEPAPALEGDLRTLIEIAARDPEGRTALIRLANAILGAVEAATPDVAPADDEAVVPMDKAAFDALVRRATGKGDELPSGPLADALRAAASLPPAPASAEDTRVGAVTTQDEADREDAREERDAHLPGLAERTRKKASLTRALAAKHGGGAPVDDALVHAAKSTGATVWMLDLADADPADLATLADCYAAVADAAERVWLLRRDEHQHADHIGDAVRALAAVQSALRITVERFRRTADEDQLAAFAWLRETTAEERIFVERHMRLDDPLDPVDLPPIAARMAAELEELQAAEERREGRKKGLGQVRYHAGRLGKGVGSDHDRQKVIEAVDRLAADGLPPSNIELRELLLPAREHLAEPADPEGGYGRVLADLDAHRLRLAARPAAVVAERAPSPDVVAVASLLRGRELVLIGGERRVEAETNIRDSFELAGVTWLTLEDDPTPAELERAIRRQDVAVVVQLIRWSRHKFGDAKEIADEHGKAFVRVKAGYNPDALARAILDQASGQLDGAIVRSDERP